MALSHPIGGQWLMCSVSMIGDHYAHRLPQTYPQISQWPLGGVVGAGPSRAEFEALKAEMQNIKELLLKAKKYDEDNGEPDCHMDEKVAILKRFAEIVGVDLSAVFGTAPNSAS